MSETAGQIAMPLSSALTAVWLRQYRCARPGACLRNVCAGYLASRSLDVRCHMPLLKVIFLIATLGAAGCAIQNVDNTCQFPSDVQIDALRPDKLVVIVGVPRFSDAGPPFFNLGGDAGEPGVAVGLIAREGSEGLSETLVPGHCENAVIRVFNLDVAPDTWSGYWKASRDKGSFSMSIAVPGLKAPVRPDELGFALVEKSSRESVVTCGCLVM